MNGTIALSNIELSEVCFMPISLKPHLKLHLTGNYHGTAFYVLSLVVCLSVCPLALIWSVAAACLQTRIGRSRCLHRIE
jgi:hypothetical protein